MIYIHVSIKANVYNVDYYTVLISQFHRCVFALKTNIYKVLLTFQTQS